MVAATGQRAVLRGRGRRCKREGGSSVEGQRSAQQVRHPARMQCWTMAILWDAAGRRHTPAGARPDSSTSQVFKRSQTGRQQGARVYLAGVNRVAGRLVAVEAKHGNQGGGHLWGRWAGGVGRRLGQAGLGGLHARQGPSRRGRMQQHGAVQGTLQGISLSMPTRGSRGSSRAAEQAQSKPGGSCRADAVQAQGRHQQPQLLPGPGRRPRR